MHVFLTTGSLLLHYSHHSYLSSFPTPLNFSHFPPHFWSPPPYSVHMSTVCNYSATPFLFLYLLIILTSSPNLALKLVSSTHLSLIPPSFLTFPTGKTKAGFRLQIWKLACMYSMKRKRAADWGEKKIYIIYIYMIACIIQVGIFLWANNCYDQGRICTVLTGTLSIKNECQHQVWNTQRFNTIYFFCLVSIPTNKN